MWNVLVTVILTACVTAGCATFTPQPATLVHDSGLYEKLLCVNDEAPNGDPMLICVPDPDRGVW